ncbi:MULTISPECIES: triosephosphate isomerase [Ehrlichia]|uniref:Triosephosphate isomerase n=1 Tax=Ehrlichia cf. muris str. EmCRT TaxID=1359167 RepID=A0A0F3NE72_9RICK|nr:MULTISPECIES: triosephosphate isomerase [Ehrlichia]KJV66012.1 triose-phosphate isomerase [Ehrlichia cf. muris str. EmCRT]OUC04766.1 triosephosphate isomerase [Ehrlichia sp. Wisconsin_h]
MSLLIVANWKMYGDFLTFSSFTKELSTNLINVKADVEIVLCPPFIALPKIVDCIPNIKLGAQNCFYEAEGKYTGEVSAKMLYSCGCSYVIVGHSERRNMFHESDHCVQLKANAAINAGLIPIICIGETLLDRESGMLKDVLLNQCYNSFPKHGKFIIAYEPVWAIGSNSIPSIDMIIESLNIIRSYDSTSEIIYGGAVSQNNIKNVIDINQLSGVLVGGASLRLDSFCNIIYGAINVRQN